MTLEEKRTKDREYQRLRRLDPLFNVRRRAYNKQWRDKKKLDPEFQNRINEASRIRYHKCKTTPAYKIGRKRRKLNTRISYYAWLQQFKNKPCFDCGVIYPPFIMEFDHKPAFDKSFNLSKGYNFARKNVLKELEKCDLVCSNCHRYRTFSRKQPIYATSKLSCDAIS